MYQNTSNLQGGHSFFISNPSTYQYIQQYIFNLAVHTTNRFSVHISTLDSTVLISISSFFVTSDCSLLARDHLRSTKIRDLGAQPLKLWISRLQNGQKWLFQRRFQDKFCFIISVHLSVHHQKLALYQYIQQYICHISTGSTYQYISVRVATLVELRQ